MTEMEIYWITRLDSIKIFFSMLCVVSSFIIGIAVISYIGIKVDGYNRQINNLTELNLAKKFMYFWIGIVISALVLTFLPTTKEMCAIKVIPLIADNEDIQAVSKEIPKLAHAWLEELKPIKKEK
jgi:hypothetical protein